MRMVQRRLGGERARPNIAIACSALLPQPEEAKLTFEVFLGTLRSSRLRVALICIVDNLSYLKPIQIES